MFKKSNLPTLEYKLLLFATSIIPIFVFILSLIIFLIIVYEHFFPPKPTIIVDEFGTEPTLAFFRLLAVVSLFISSIFVFFKRIFISIGLYLLTIVYFIFWLFYFHRYLQEMLKLNSELGFNDFPNKSYAEIFLSYLNLVDVFFLCFIVFLFFWHIKIVVQDYYRRTI